MNCADIDTCVHVYEYENNQLMVQIMGTTGAL